MKKKIKELTREEMNKMCSFHLKKGTGCANLLEGDVENIKCPLWLTYSCLRGFIEKMQHIEREVEIDE